MDASEEPLERGFLCVTAHGAYGDARTAKVQQQQRRRYCMLFGASERGVERLEVYANEAPRGTPTLIVPLESCVKIAPAAPDSLSVLVFGKRELHELAAPTARDAAKWTRALQTVAFGCHHSDDNENELYSFCGEGVFDVRLRASDASLRCRLEPAEYRLCIAADSIELRDTDTDCLRASWPYRYVRRYGYRHGRFTFEAGRKCDTGEGVFHLEHSNHKEIFRCLSLKLQSLKRDKSKEPPPPPPTKPVKPPRKCGVPPEYDKVEVRSEAWRTLGVDDPDHSESASFTAAPKIIYLPDDVDAADYDRLQHFGSTSRLNREGYEPVALNRTPEPTPRNAAAATGVWSDYDVVENVMQLKSVRLADDSHTGYGALRKPSVPGPQVAVRARPPTPPPEADEDEALPYADVAHRAFDGASYAIVSKPKRV